MTCSKTQVLNHNKTYGNWEYLDMIDRFSNYISISIYIQRTVLYCGGLIAHYHLRRSQMRRVMSHLTIVGSWCCFLIQHIDGYVILPSSWGFIDPLPSCEQMIDLENPLNPSILQIIHDYTRYYASICTGFGYVNLYRVPMPGACCRRVGRGARGAGIAGRKVGDHSMLVIFRMGKVVMGVSSSSWGYPQMEGS